MGSTFRDLRYGLRMLLQNRGFTAVVLVSLALGIGANTTIFSVLNAVLFRSFPVKEPERLVVLVERNTQREEWRVPTFAAFREWKRQNHVFEDIALAGMGGDAATLTTKREAAWITFEEVGVNFLSVAGVAPALGRAFLPEDSKPGDGTTIILSHDFWQRQFAGDKDIIGQTVSVEGMKMTVIGVMPPGFWLVPWETEVDGWSTFDASKNPTIRFMTPVARLRPGTTLEQARAEMDTLFRSLAQQNPEVYRGWNIQVDSLQEWAVGETRKTLYLLLGAVGFVLLISCANVANLLLARASARQKEIAVRSSLGAGRFRLIRQLLTESLALALLGGLLGLFFATWGIDLFRALTPPQWFPRTKEIGIDTTVLGYSLALSLVTGFLFGLAPAVQASRPALNESLKEAGGRSGGGSGARGRSVLVTFEIGLALVLLMGAGLMINSFIRLQNVNLGFDRRNLLRAEIFPGGPKYWKQLERDMKRVEPQADVFLQQLLERAQHLPGVVSASIGSLDRMADLKFRIVGRPPESATELPYSEISPDFFRTMRIPLLKGRVISDRDIEGAPWVVVVSESFARRFFPKEDPIGKVLYSTRVPPNTDLVPAEDPPREIVGVVGDVKYWGPRWQSDEVIYGSYRQHPWEYFGGQYSFHLLTRLILRTATDPTSLARAIQRIVAEMDKEQVVHGTKTMEEAASEFAVEPRFWMRLFGIFAGLALFLAMVGIYGVVTYSVSRRTHEIGVRMAMGADRQQVLKLVVGQGLKLAIAGVTLGIAGSLALTRLATQLLYEVKPTDPLTIATVAVLLTGAALGAAYIPARRATRVAPMDSLRHE